MPRPVALVIVALIAALAVALVSAPGVSAEPEDELRKRVVALEAEVLRLDGMLSYHAYRLDGNQVAIADGELDGYRRDRRIAKCIKPGNERRETRCIVRWLRNP